jgi:hypothetical protein
MQASTRSACAGLTERAGELGSLFFRAHDSPSWAFWYAEHVIQPTK